MARNKKKKKKPTTRDPANTSARTRSKVDVAELHEALQHGRVPLLVDVRTGWEFRSGHVDGSVNIPLGQLASAELPAEEVWLICRTGNRSATAAAQLAAKGKRVVDVAGGTMAWTAKGLPLIGGPPAGAPDWSSLALPLLASLTLGLAPFLPEPHIVGKLRWVAGGAVGMAPKDWFDLAMHGAPWVWLIVATARVLLGQARPSAEPSASR